MDETQLETGLANYFDINRRMKLAEKFDEERSTQLFDHVLNILVTQSEQQDARHILQ